MFNPDLNGVGNEILEHTLDLKTPDSYRRHIPLSILDDPSFSPDSPQDNYNNPFDPPQGNTLETSYTILGSVKNAPARHFPDPPGRTLPRGPRGGARPSRAPGRTSAPPWGTPVRACSGTGTGASGGRGEGCPGRPASSRSRK